MRVMILYNPIAGAGRAAEIAEALETPLGAAGHATTVAETSLAPPEEWLDGALAEVDLLVVVGGDGAVRLASASAARTGTPIYHFPFGTENLFAREFGADRSEPRLVAAIERFEVRRVDVGEANGSPFLLMASVGFDAEVVHDLAAHRTGGISHRSYAKPIFRQFTRWQPPRISVTIDGAERIDAQPGFLVVANSRQYARRLDPARHASMTDGYLDVVFFPTRTRRELLGWLVRCIRGTHVDDRRLVYERGQTVEWRCEDACLYQVDGDRPDVAAEDRVVADVQISLRPSTLPVLLP